MKHRFAKSKPAETAESATENRSATPEERAQRQAARDQDARQAWAEHQARKKAIEANTARLRALRLERERSAQS
jgi:hypothetical protein